jgi:hypothetical protein
LHDGQFIVRSDRKPFPTQEAESYPSSAAASWMSEPAISRQSRIHSGHNGISEDLSSAKRSGDILQ